MSEEKKPKQKRPPQRRPRPRLEEFRAFYELAGPSFFGFHLVLAARFFDKKVADVLRSQELISLQQWRVVSQLWVRGDITVRRLAEHAAVDRAEVSRAVTELEKQGLVERRDNPSDQRSPLLSLTELGKERTDSAREPIRELLEILLEDISIEDLEAAERVLYSFTSKAFML